MRHSLSPGRLLPAGALLFVGVLSCAETAAPKDRSPAALVENDGANQTAPVGVAVNTPPSVKVVDAQGASISGVAVIFSVTSGGGAITGATQTSDANGVARVGSWTMGTIAGLNTLTSTATGASSHTFSATAVAGSPTGMILGGGNAQAALAGRQLPVNPSVKVTDANGNPVAGVAVNFAIVSGGGSLVGPLPALTNATGLASVAWTLGPNSGPQQMTAVASGLAGSPITFDATARPADPNEIQNALATALRGWFNTYESLAGAGTPSTQARTYSASWQNADMHFYSSIDNPSASPDQWNRNTRSWQNDPTAAARANIALLWSGGPSASGTTLIGYYGALRTAADVLISIRKDSVNLGNPANTRRAEAVALLVEGVALAGIALTYDKGFLIDENVAQHNANSFAPLTYVTRKVMRDSAVAKLVDAVRVAGIFSFTTPTAWTNGIGYSNAQIAAIANSMAALTLAYYPRDDVEAAAVNWQQVATFASAGISSGVAFDFKMRGDGCGNFCPDILSWFNSMDIGRVSTRVGRLLDSGTQLDPWPTSGNAQPASPDKRLGDGSFGNASMTSTFGNVPKTASAGTDFAWSSMGAIFSASRGSYHQSNLAHIRYDASGTQATSGIYGAYGDAPTITAIQSDLILAEAQLRTGNPTGAVALINKTRVTRGGLAAATASIAVGSPSDGPCTATGKLSKDLAASCTVWSMLLYEKEIELLGLGAAPYFEQRRLPVVAAGGRFVQGLIPGTPREMPVPWSVLMARNEGLYSWGGSGAPNSPPP